MRGTWRTNTERRAAEALGQIKRTKATVFLHNESVLVRAGSGPILGTFFLVACE
jgi:hypothetical protein